MAIQEITQIGSPITNNDISWFEDAIGGRLPAAYRRFLLKYNGGRPKPYYTHELALSIFYGIKPTKKMYDLLVNCRRMQKWLPKDVIPIGQDTFGNEICLAVKGKNRGKLYFWDHEGAPDGADMAVKYPMIVFNEGEDEPEPTIWPGNPDLVLIADSFTEFLDDFHEFIPDEPKVKRKRPK
ncbi:MAG: SMI1/KNR4 family protein [Nitrospira sp.]|nr:SMI1/KNR4 family protein [Nitrospira sp.]